MPWVSPWYSKVLLLTSLKVPLFQYHECISCLYRYLVSPGSIYFSSQLQVMVCMWYSKYGIYHSGPGLLHLTQYFLFSSIFLQIPDFFSIYCSLKCYCTHVSQFFSTYSSLNESPGWFCILDIFKRILIKTEVKVLLLECVQTLSISPMDL